MATGGTIAGFTIKIGDSEEDIKIGNLDTSLISTSISTATTTTTITTTKTYTVTFTKAEDWLEDYEVSFQYKVDIVFITGTTENVIVGVATIPKGSMSATASGGSYKYTTGTTPGFNVQTTVYGATAKTTAYPCCLYTEGKTCYDDQNYGVYVGTNGIGLGSGFYVDATGYLYATNIYVEGKANLSELTVTDSANFETDILADVLTAVSVNINESLKFQNTYAITTGSGGSDAVELTATLTMEHTGGYYYYNVNITDSSGSPYALTEDKDFEVLCYFDGGFIYGTTYKKATITVSAGSSSGQDYEFFFAEREIGEYYFTETRTDTYTWTENGTDYSGFFFNGDLIPTSNGDYDLGNSEYRWYDVWCTRGNWNGSDRKLKNNIEPLSSAYSVLFDNLVPVRYKLNNDKDDVYYTGFIAQEVENAIALAGLSTSDFGGCICDKNTDIRLLKYTDFIALCVNEIQILKEEVKELKEKIR